MFSRKSSASKSPASKALQKPGKAGPAGLSFIGPEVVISGDVTTSAQLHVDGRIDGGVRCAHLCQGASGIVAGDIVADDARIAGLVQGTVNARTLVIDSSGRVAGDVTYETISIAAGAQIDGRLARREALAEGAPALLIATPTDPESAGTGAGGKTPFPHDQKRLGIG